MQDPHRNAVAEAIERLDEIDDFRVDVHGRVWHRLDDEWTSEIHGPGRLRRFDNWVIEGPGLIGIGHCGMGWWPIRNQVRHHMNPH